MRHRIRLGRRVLSYLDSAPSPSEIAQDVLPATPADAGRAVSPGHVLVLLHAFPMNSAMWESQVAAAPPSWRFLAPDMRGCGESDAGDECEDVSIDDYAADVVALLDRLEVPQAVIAGVSMGGYTAFALWRTAAQRVRGLVLSNTRAEADDDAGRKARRSMIALLDRDGVAAVADRMLPNLLGRTTLERRPAVRERARAIANANGADGVRGAIRRLMTRPDSSGLLSTIRCPALVIASDEDAVISLDVARGLHARIPGAHLATIAAAGHLSNLERPDEFNVVLHRFLADDFGE